MANLLKKQKTTSKVHKRLLEMWKTLTSNIIRKKDTMEVRKLLQSYIKQYLVDHVAIDDELMLEAPSPGDYMAGEELEALEKSAKEKYEAAQAELAAWDVNDRKKQAFLAKAKELGMKPDSERARKLKTNPDFAFDPKLSQKQRKTLEDNLEKAEDNYSAFNPVNNTPFEGKAAAMA